MNNKLDIVFYIRNLLLNDIINEIVLGYKNDIINFLCHPVLSLEKFDEGNLSESVKNYKGIDFDKLYQNISELIEKPDKTSKEKILIYLLHQKLLELE